MYFISTAFEAYCKNTRSKFENLLKDPITSSNHVMTIEAVHFQKKFDVFDESIIFISFIENDEQNKTPDNSKLAQGEFSLFKYSISLHNKVVITAVKLEKGYYPATEFIQSFNLFSTRFIQSKVVMRQNKENKIEIIVKSNTTVYANTELFAVLGFNTKILNTSKKNFRTSSKYKKHSSLLNPKINYTFKKIRSGIKKAQIPFNKNLHLPNTIKIYCDQADNVADSGKIRKIAAVLPGVVENDCMRYDFYPINPLKVTLKSSHINSFGFRLGDDKGNRLKFSDGFATYIKVSISPPTIKENMEEEYITCLSSDPISKKMFSSNKNNSFTILLPKTLERGPYKKWYMSLLNVSMPSSTPNVHEGQNSIYILDADRLVKDMTIVPTRNYSTAHEIVKTIKEKLEEMNIQIWIENNGRIAYQNVGNNEQTLKIDADLALTLGLINKVTIGSTPLVILTPFNLFMSPFEPDLKITQHLYCKLICGQVKQTYFGDSSEEILRFLPLKTLENVGSHFQEFYQKIRVEINSSSLNTLDFKLTKENSSELIDFKNDEIPTHLTILIEREN